MPGPTGTPCRSDRLSPSCLPPVPEQLPKQRRRRNASPRCNPHATNKSCCLCMDGSKNPAGPAAESAAIPAICRSTACMDPKTHPSALHAAIQKSKKSRHAPLDPNGCDVQLFRNLLHAAIQKSMLQLAALHAAIPRIHCMQLDPSNEQKSMRNKSVTRSKPSH